MLTCCFDYFFFFKQKTAYEMRISDWSSDVCSSDLLRRRLQKHAALVLIAPRPRREVERDEAIDDRRDRRMAELQPPCDQARGHPLARIDLTQHQQLRRRPPRRRGKPAGAAVGRAQQDRKSTRLDTSH